MNDCQTLVFTAPRCVEVRREAIPMPGAGQALVRTICSAISPGTEHLIYTGQFPEELAADETISSLSGKLAFPLKYGYAAAGEVVAVGKGVDPAWIGRRVFSFHPHQSYLVAAIEELHIIPLGLSAETAIFLPNMETAVNFVMDGRPVIGERVVVVGQGVVGLLTTALLGRFPLADLITFDRYPNRRRLSLELGAHTSFDPAELNQRALEAVADLCFELSGSPAALNLAVQLTGYEGRVVIGSWYGRKRAELDLGGRFHRSRIRLVSSQVSTLASEFGGTWNKGRRLNVAWEMLRQVQPERLITHRFTLAEAAKAYNLLDTQAEATVQIIFTYS